MVKNIPAMCKTQLQSLGREDPLEKNTLVFLPGESHVQRSLGGAGGSATVHKVANNRTHLSNFHFHLKKKSWLFLMFVCF